MRRIALFVEDDAHEKIIGAIAWKVAAEFDFNVEFDWRNAVGGHGKVIAELKVYIRDLERQGTPWPDLIVIATDANCKGLNERSREIGLPDMPRRLFSLPFPTRTLSAGCYSTAPHSERCSAVVVRRRVASASADFTNRS